MIGHLLNTSVEVWRPVTTPDGMGGQVASFELLATLAARLSQPTQVSERDEAQADGSDITHADVFLPPGADVRRNDQLRTAGIVLQVDGVYRPSIAIYLKAECTSRQPEAV